MNPFALIKQFLASPAPKAKSAQWPFNIDLGSGSLSQPLSDPFRSSTWVSAAIKLVARPITEVPLQFSKSKRGGIASEDPSLSEYWNEPAIGQDKRPLGLSDTIENTVISLKLWGEFFWVFDDTLFADRALPFPEAGVTLPRFMIVRPGRMMHRFDRSSGAIVAWELTTASGAKHLLDPKQVVHVRFPNPYDDYRGLSEYDAARVAAEADYLAGRFKLNLWSASGDRGQFITAGEGTILSDDQIEQIQAQLREKKELAARGIFKGAFLSANIKVEDPKTQMVDAAFVASRPQDWHQVAIAFGVPPSMFEVVASYSVGAASDWYRLIRDTCIPTSRKLSDAVEAVMKLQGQKLFSSFVWTSHPVMLQVLMEKIPAAVQLWDRGWPWERINEWLGLGMPEFDGWEVSYLPFSVTPADADGMPIVPEQDLAEDELDTTPADLEQEMFCEPGGERVVWKAGEKAVWLRHMNARRPAWKKFTSAFNRELMKARADVLKKLEMVPRGTQARATAFELIFDAHKFKQGLLLAFKGPTLFALNAAGNEVKREIDQPEDYEMAPRKVIDYLGQRKADIQAAGENVYDQIRGVLQEGFDAGDSTKEIADNIRERFNDISKGRAKTIAITETAIAYGQARDDSMKESGVPYKKWLTSKGPTVRPAHKAAEGQTVKVDDKFSIGGVPMIGPGDPTAPASQVCNCHCVAIAVSKSTGEIDA